MATKPKRFGQLDALGANRREKARQRRYDARRPSPHKRGYTAAWYRLRNRLVIERGCVCAHCGSMVVLRKRDATSTIPVAHLDHVISKARGGTDEPSNLQVLCHPCHSVKTAVEDSAFAGRGSARADAGAEAGRGA